MDIWKVLRGTMNSFFQIGGTAGPRLKSNGGNLDARNAADAAYVNLRMADPVLANDGVNLEYLQSTFGPGSWNTVNVPSAGSYTVTSAVAGQSSVVATGSGPLFACKVNQSNAQCDTFLQSGGSFPGTGWWVELVCNDLPYDYSAQYPLIGVCVATGTTSADNAFTMARYWDNSSSGVLPRLQTNHFHPSSTTTSASANTTNDFSVDKGSGVLRHRILSDGTNLYYQQSWDGFFWQPWFSESLPASIAYWGFCIGNASSSGTTGRVAATIYRNVLHSALTVAPAAITAVSNTTPIQVTAPGHGANTGDVVAIHGASPGGVNTGVGTLLTNLWVVQVVDANNVKLIGSTALGAGGAAGTLSVISR